MKISVVLLLMTCACAQVNADCLLDTKQIVVCDQNGENQLDNYEADVNETDDMSVCSGYYYCMNNKYCTDRHSGNVNITCKQVNNTFICQCLDEIKCLFPVITCYNISTSQVNETKLIASPGDYCHDNLCCPDSGCKQIQVQTHNDSEESFINLDKIKQVNYGTVGLYIDLSGLYNINWLPYHLGNVSNVNVRLCELVTQINLRNDNIIIIVTRAFYYLDNLKQIDLSDNKIRQIEQNAFAYCTKLTDLNLTRNYIEVIGYRSFFQTL